MAQLVKKSTCRVGDVGLTPELGRPPGEGNSYPLQCSGWENSMDCIVHGVTESDATELLSLSVSPVVKKLPSNAGDTGLILGGRTEIPHSVGQLSP